MQIETHPNLVCVEGCAGILDEPSQHMHVFDPVTRIGTPGPRMIIPGDVARVFLPTLLGQPFEVSYGEGKKPYVPVGHISEAFIQGNRIMVSGFIWALSFPKIVQEIETQDLGQCLSLENCKFEPDGEHVRLTQMLFSGSTIMKKNNVGFAETHIRFKAKPNPKARPKITVI